MNIKEQMYDDAMRVAGTIVEDLGISIYRASTARALYLCESHGSSPVRYRKLPASTRGRCWTEDEGEIDIDVRQCGSHLGAVIIHELTHRLSFCSCRYEDLNSPRMALYDRHKFQEIVANIAEWLFYQMQRFAEICAGVSASKMTRSV